MGDWGLNFCLRGRVWAPARVFLRFCWELALLLFSFSSRDLFLKPLLGQICCYLFKLQIPEGVVSNVRKGELQVGKAPRICLLQD